MKEEHDMDMIVRPLEGEMTPRYRTPMTTQEYPNERKISI